MSAAWTAIQKAKNLAARSASINSSTAGSPADRN